MSVKVRTSKTKRLIAIFSVLTVLTAGAGGFVIWQLTKDIGSDRGRADDNPCRDICSDTEFGCCRAGVRYYISGDQCLSSTSPWCGTTGGGEGVCNCVGDTPTCEACPGACSDGVCTGEVGGNCSCSEPLDNCQDGKCCGGGCSFDNPSVSPGNILWCSGGTATEQALVPGQACYPFCSGTCDGVDWSCNADYHIKIPGSNGLTCNCAQYEDQYDIVYTVNTSKACGACGNPVGCCACCGLNEGQQEVPSCTNLVISNPISSIAGSYGADFTLNVDTKGLTYGSMQWIVSCANSGVVVERVSGTTQTIPSNNGSVSWSVNSPSNPITQRFSFTLPAGVNSSTCTVEGLPNIDGANRPAQACRQQISITRDQPEQPICTNISPKDVEITEVRSITFTGTASLPATEFRWRADTDCDGNMDEHQWITNTLTTASSTNTQDFSFTPGSSSVCRVEVRVEEETATRPVCTFEIPVLGQPICTNISPKNIEIREARSITFTGTASEPTTEFRWRADTDCDGNMDEHEWITKTLTSASLTNTQDFSFTPGSVLVCRVEVRVADETATRSICTFSSMPVPETGVMDVLPYVVTLGLLVLGIYLYREDLLLGIPKVHINTGIKDSGKLLGLKLTRPKEYFEEKTLNELKSKSKKRINE